MDLVANLVGDGTITLGRDGRITSLDQAAADLFGQGREQLIGCPVAALWPQPAEERAREDERSRIARDLHDELGGLLTGIRAYLAVALEGGGMPHQHLADTCALTDAAIDAVRRVVDELRPGALDQLGLWDALEWQAGQCAERGGLACAVDVDPACAALILSPARSTAVFRIVQEALANVLRHAGASRVSLEARRDGAALTLRLADDGGGLAPLHAGPGARGHWGLQGMNERARGLGAELSVSGAAGHGTVMVLRVPLTVHDV